ncbi:hypothetical protein IQ07DRAFT_507390 [Pyrenochaeta sp. DS3sAY3a]|nr:hypothetical protein IQ07DRAFT_507390 [Pyrenochaeta sp. DS3sAY3a]
MKQTLDFAAVGDFDNGKRLHILGKIDNLRELGVGENVSLPQVVVVGDQSSGKSSLLEGLTGLSFPVASDLCTRSATQIVLRRTPVDVSGVKVTIIPGPEAQMDEETMDSLQSFEKTFKLEEFDGDMFQSILNEAAERMGLPGPNTKNIEDIEKRFSDDILKIEISGPDHHHLGLVDVPGLFHNPTKYQTAEDREVIRKLIETYITDKRTIILAVMDARNNLANQEVFSMARAADPGGKRTVGIITKCDALQSGDEQGVLRIAKNDVEKLTHGWFAVKNRSTQEISEGVTIADRHKREKAFFSTTAPWTELKKDRVGISPLKAFLGGLLHNHITSEFPEVVKDIEIFLAKTQAELDLLGPSRQTTVDQRRYLTRIVTKYQKGASNSLSGNYDPGLESQSPMKLRMHIRNLNDAFLKTMQTVGHAMIFRTVDGKKDEEFDRKTDHSVHIMEWIKELYQDSRGAELPGTVNPWVLENMFRQQSSPWRKIATDYFQSVTKSINDFNRANLAQIIPDNDLRERIETKLAAPAKLAFANAVEDLDKILNDEQGGILQTLNPAFATTLSSIREERVLARLKASGMDEVANMTSGQVMKSIHLSNEKQAVIDIHDLLKSYYKVAMARFTDNVVMEVTERYLSSAHGPVRGFSPEMVGEWEDDELMDLAGENFATSSARNELTAKLDRFQKALKIAKEDVN